MRRTCVALGLPLLVTAVLVAQPVAPTPERLAGLRAMSQLVPHAAAAGAPFTVNTASREEVRQFYRAIYSASEGATMSWTGSYTTGAAGDTSAAFKEATRVRINFFRALAGVPAVITLNSAFSTKDQQAALMMSANNTLQHTGIPTSWTFYTAAGAEAAANSNLALGNAGPDAITAYMDDDGSNNAAVGHRRWLIYPQTREMGTGDVPGNSTFNAANATWVIDSQFGATRPATRTTEVPYPPAGYVPYQLVWPRWSFSYPGADFSAATVTMTRAGQSVAVALEPLTSGVGEPALVWRYDGLSGDSGAAHAKPAADTTYTVSVNNVRIGGAAQNFSYNVAVFDPDVAGSDATPVAVTGSASPAVGVANSYVAAKPSFADSFDWRTLALAAFTKTYSAETGLDGLTATTTTGYNVVQSIAVGAGAASYRLTHPSPRSTQLLLLPETFYVSGAGAAVTLLSRLMIATPIETARVQVSTDDGASWTDVFTQAGTSDGGSSFPVATDGAFVNRSISLAAYAGRTVRVRLAFTVEDSGVVFVPTSTNTVGWFIDNLTLTGVQSATAGAATNVAGGGTAFSFAPAAAGALGLQARGVLFGAYPLEWGPVALVTAVDAGGVVNPARLINLSILAPLAAGESMTLGTVLGGANTSGQKPLLVRAAGPSLTQFGISAYLPNPTLALNSTSSNSAVLVAANDNGWGGGTTLSNAFAAVGAFPYTGAGSKDAALYQPSLAAGNYTVRVGDAGSGSGTVIAELYDATPAGAFTTATPRLINVSVLKQLGGGDSLTAGFVIGGSGSKQILIRAVGPGLDQFNLSGTMPDPQLALNQAGVAAPIKTNNDWGGDPALAAAFTQVGAFALTSTASKDAALLVTLTPGNYTAQVTSFDGASGRVLVEVYEVP